MDMTHSMSPYYFIMRGNVWLNRFLIDALSADCRSFSFSLSGAMTVWADYPPQRIRFEFVRSARSPSSGPVSITLLIIIGTWDDERERRENTMMCDSLSEV